MNGTGVVTPVWGKLYVWTGADSWKVKRIRNNGRVRLVPSDARGNPEGEWEEQNKLLREVGQHLLRESVHLTCQFVQIVSHKIDDKMLQPCTFVLS